MKSIHKEGLDSAQKKRMMHKSASPDFLDPTLEWRRIFSEAGEHFCWWWLRQAGP